MPSCATFGKARHYEETGTVSHWGKAAGYGEVRRRRVAEDAGGNVRGQLHRQENRKEEHTGNNDRQSHIQRTVHSSQ